MARDNANINFYAANGPSIEVSGRDAGEVLEDFVTILEGLRDAGFAMEVHDVSRLDLSKPADWETNQAILDAAWNRGYERAMEVVANEEELV